MSKVERTLDLTPPRMKSAQERLVSKGHPCGYCQGRFNPDAGNSFVVWEEGILRTSNKIKE